jgi:3-hydroxyacyl-CoA dehydrogenase
MEIRKAAVIGAGTMGSQIAGHIANAGIPVLLLDRVPEAGPRSALAERAVARLGKADPPPLMQRSAARLIEPGNLEDDLPRLAEADWIIEAVVEDLEVKRAVLAAIDGARRPGSIVSSNTSTLPLAALAEAAPASLRGDLAITHFFNPPRFLRLVELVAGPAADAGRLAALADFADRRLGKGVVRAKDTPGFIANRIGAFWIQSAVNQAFAMGLRIEDADAVLGRPVGFPKTGVFGLLDLVGRFFALYEGRPVADNAGGSGINDSLALFLVASLAAPRLIVESGVHKGHGTWLLRQACPDAVIHAFDIDLGGLVHRDPAARYHEGDWSAAALGPVEGERALAVFDDHVNQCRRVREAHERGFRLAVFDDNFPADQLYATGTPPLPTLAMLLDPDCMPGTELRWLRRGKPRAYTYTEEDTYGAAGLIDRAVMLPDLAPATRHPPQSGLTVVRLRGG